MNKLQRWYIYSLLFYVQLVCASGVSSVPVDLLGSMAPEKKSKNTIMASVMNSATNDRSGTKTVNKQEKDSRLATKVDNPLGNVKHVVNKDQSIYPDSDKLVKKENDPSVLSDPNINKEKNSDNIAALTSNEGQSENVNPLLAAIAQEDLSSDQGDVGNSNVVNQEVNSESTSELDNANSKTDNSIVAPIDSSENLSSNNSQDSLNIDNVSQEKSQDLVETVSNSSASKNTNPAITTPSNEETTSTETKKNSENINKSEPNSESQSMIKSREDGTFLKEKTSHQKESSDSMSSAKEIATKKSDEESKVKPDVVVVHTAKQSKSQVLIEEPKKEKGVLYQDSGFIDDHESVSFNFEETDLSNVASYMETIHSVKFITEDIISPNKDAKGLSGHKITFRTNKVLTKKESWDLFLTFLHIAGLDIVPMSHAGFYKIVPFAKANSEVIPTYIGVDSQVLPDNDMVIRYVYFARNVDPAKVQNILKNMQAGSAKLEVFTELKAMIFTDRSCNIRSLMQIVSELDKGVLPESLSVIHLHRANVDDVIKLYSSLKPTAGAQQPQRGVWQPAKKETSLEYFPQDVQMFADKRTNSLILLGAAKGISKIEEFVQKYIDIDVNRDVPPIFTYQLEYTNAADIKSILTQTIAYGSSTPAGQVGGVRDGVKYFSKMNIVAEPHSNSLIINSSKDDFEAIKPLIQELDQPQKQIGLEVLIVQVSDSETKVLGSQLSGPGGPNAGSHSHKGPQTFAQSLSAQTSGIMNGGGASTAPVIKDNTQNTSANESYSIKTSLSSLLTSGIVNEAGSILVTFGKPIWALFKILKTMVSVHVVANPFVVVSNNSQAKVSVGEERRIKTSEVISSGGTSATGFQGQQSNLGFTITPQINKENIVNLSIQVTNNQFSVAGSENSALMDKKEITTFASVANGEVLVLGGIMQEQSNSTHRGVPFLENIPLIGWFFKSKAKGVSRNHFLIFISPRVLDPIHQYRPNGMDRYTQYKMEEAQKNIELMEDLDWFASKRDPIQKRFFGDEKSKTLKELTGHMVDHKAVASKKRTKKNSNVKEIVLDPKKKKSKKVKKENKKIKHKKASEVKERDLRVALLDQDFIPSKDVSSLHAKNALSNSVMHGGKHV